MEIYLIGCSKEKELGGSQSSSLENLSFNDLLYSCRRTLVSLYEETHEQLDWKKCMPAYERYTGRTLYSADVKAVISNNPNQVFIVSALFGLIRPSDLIPYYDLKMTDAIGGIFVNSFWRNQHENCSKCILNNVLNTIKGDNDQFVNLLSIPYQNAFCGFKNGNKVQLNYIPDLINAPSKDEVNFNSRMGHWKRDYLLKRLRFK